VARRAARGGAPPSREQPRARPRSARRLRVARFSRAPGRSLHPAVRTRRWTASLKSTPCA